MTDTWVRHEVSADGAVHTVTFDKPPGNVIDIALCEQLREAIAAAAEADDGKVLVLRGAGKHFSFGASVEEHLPEKAPEMLAAVGGVARDLIRFPYPTIAGIQGSCLGGGVDVILSCGIVIAEETATLALPEIKLGVFPPVATALLAGRGAEEVILTGRNLSADEAKQAGIVNVVAPDGGLHAMIDDYVEEHFAPRSPLSLRVATTTLRGLGRDEVERRLDEAERIYVEELLPTHDGVEGINAFLEKRPPVWKNA